MPQCEHSAITGELLILSHASQDTVLFQKKRSGIALPTPHNPFQAPWKQGHHFKLVQTLLPWQTGLSGSPSNIFLAGMTPWSPGRVRTEEQRGSHDTSLKSYTWLISLSPLWTSLPFFTPVTLCF